MAYQLKYYYEFYGLRTVQYKTEIYQNTTDTIVPEKITGWEDQFILEYSSTDEFEPVKSSGCEITLLSTSDRKFYSLYTADMFEYQIRFYRANNLIWVGYLNSELYSEPFNKKTNYKVSFTGNDGFTLLERINYLDNSGNHYSGLTTQWSTISTIISKLNLPYQNVYVSLSTTSSNFTIGSTETIFHKTYSNNQNWYNEDGDPETCRTVLEEILKTYGAFIIQDKASLYITDINTLAKATGTTFKKYDLSFNYVADEVINLNLGDLDNKNIGYFIEQSQQNNTLAGFNRQIVKYSPYLESQILKLEDDEFSNIVSTTTIGNSPYNWTETIYSNSITFNNYGNGKFASMQGLSVANQDEKSSYLKITKYATNQAIPANLSFTNKAELPIYIPSNSNLKISCKGYIRTVDDLNGTNTTKNFIKIKLRCRLKIGNKQYYNNVWDISGRVTGWISSTSTDYDKCLQLDFEEQTITTDGGYQYSERTVIDNKLVDLKILAENGGGGIVNKDIQLELYSNDFLVPLNAGFTGGQMIFEIYDFDVTTVGGLSVDQYNSAINSIKDIRIKDLTFTVVDLKGKEFNKNDVEYIGELNKLYKNKADDIKLYQGTSKTNTSVEKAALIGYNGTAFYFLNSWSREGYTSSKIENLLLRSLKSNNYDKRVELTGTIKRANFSVFGCLKYTSYQPNKNFMIVGTSKNFNKEEEQITIHEIINDSLEI